LEVLTAVTVNSFSDINKTVTVNSSSDINKTVTVNTSSDINKPVTVNSFSDINNIAGSIDRDSFDFLFIMNYSNTGYNYNVVFLSDVRNIIFKRFLFPRVNKIVAVNTSTDINKTVTVNTSSDINKTVTVNSFSDINKTVTVNMTFCS
jgi:UDP-3-O-[3-hydroxymyristoyl] glucosamine N-acyltransferase